MCAAGCGAGRDATRRDATWRGLQVTELMVSRGSEQRVVKHFHFTTWPDFGVPEPPETLARFVRAFRERCPPDARPVVRRGRCTGCCTAIPFAHLERDIGFLERYLCRTTDESNVRPG